ncbi:hypothetical protein F8388_010174 [Cannabis sativa]|uniref:Calmodulin-binding domain-containing protein n=1 Tax=Cannabis sativa TaxID=3483 RepID=A0A7J6GS72_CANSA|nr:hypothetical protein F8388_010174 [Cannabis sativa]
MICWLRLSFSCDIVIVRKVPHYLRASTGSCHDFCKFGKKHEAEELARYPIPKRLAAKLSASRRSIETAADSSAKRNSSTVKLKNSPGSRTYSPKDGNISNGKALTRSLDSLNVVKTDERKKPSSVKHEAASALPSKPRTHDTPKTMKQKLSASTEKLELSSKKSSTTKAKPKSFSGKNQTSPNLNSVAVKPLSSPESSGRLNGNGETRIGKRTGSRVAPKKGLASPKVSLPNKTSPKKSVVSLNRKQQGSLKKNASPLETNNEVRIAEPTESKNGEVPEKTLYVIKMETEKNTSESNQNETCDAEVESLPYILSLSPKSSPLPECLSSPSSSPLPGGCSSSSPYSSPHEEEEDEKQKQEGDNEEREEDEMESECTISESEDYTFSEDSETESMENLDTLDSNNKMRRSSGLVCEEEDDDKGSKLKFRRGKVVDMHTENDAPRKLKFRRGRVLENQNVTADARRRRFKKREEVDDTNAEAGSEKVVLKHQDVQGKKDAQGLFNNVIEETASKLAETRKSKVKALVGAFETVISLQDKKPSNTARVGEVETMILNKQYRCIHSASCQCTKGHLSEEAIYIVFDRLNWNPKLIATLSCVCKWFDDLAKRVLWKQFCHTRAPKMMNDLQSGGSHNVDGNWRALGKLLIYCSGCQRGGLFNNIQIPGHFVHKTRFSRTSGKSFLLPQCRTDELYVSDPCEHLNQGDDGDVGFFRGVFKAFAMSKVRKVLIKRMAEFHPTEVCPYCKAKMWNMLQAKMIPQSASVRLGAYEDCIEYYVCLNGHMLGICTLLPLSDSEETSEVE